MHCVKLPGQSLMARDFDRQVVDIQVRVAVLNPLHHAWHTHHRGRRISLSGERGSPTTPRFVQQSPADNILMYLQSPGT